MPQDRFELVFGKLTEQSRGSKERESLAALVEYTAELRQEAEEIAELRRLAIAIAEPQSQSYTTT